jgi:hypothetical protein
MTLTEFLEARITEDELTTQAAVEFSPDWRAQLDFRDVKDDTGHYVVVADGLTPRVEQAAHIARQDPARVLRECEAKRGVVADLLRRRAIGDVDGAAALTEVLVALAAAYADHPDHRAVWPT